MVVLIKPQYEGASPHALVRGVVVDSAERQRIVSELLSWAQEQGWRVWGLVASPIRGSGGNQEYLAHLRREGAGPPPEDK